MRLLSSLIWPSKDNPSMLDKSITSSTVIAPKFCFAEESWAFFILDWDLSFFFFSNLFSLFSTWASFTWGGILSSKPGGNIGPELDDDPTVLEDGGFWFGHLRSGPYLLCSWTGESVREIEILDWAKLFWLGRLFGCGTSMSLYGEEKSMGALMGDMGGFFIMEIWTVSGEK